MKETDAFTGAFVNLLSRVSFHWKDISNLLPGGPSLAANIQRALHRRRNWEDPNVHIIDFHLICLEVQLFPLPSTVPAVLSRETKVKKSHLICRVGRGSGVYVLLIQKHSESDFSHSPHSDNQRSLTPLIPDLAWGHCKSACLLLDSHPILEIRLQFIHSAK